MMDYAGRAAQADTYPKLLRLNAREYGGDIALREKDFGLWHVFTWNDYQTRVRDFAFGMVELGVGRCDVIGIIQNGKLLAEGTLQQLRDNYGEQDLEEIFVKVVAPHYVSSEDH